MEWRASLVRTWGPPQEDNGGAEVKRAKGAASRSSRRIARHGLLDEDLVITANAKVAWKFDPMTGAARKVKKFGDEVLFMQVIRGAAGAQFVLCALASGVVVVWDGEDTHHTVLEVDRQQGKALRRSAGDVVHFSVGKSLKPGTFVLASIGYGSQYGFEVLEMDLSTKGWNALLLEDFSSSPEILGVIRCISCAQDSYFGLVAVAAMESIMLYDHKGCICNVQSIGVRTMLWFNTFLITLSDHDGKLRQWVVVPEAKKKKKNRALKKAKITLHEVESSRRSLSRDLPCTSTSLAVFPGSSRFFAVCVFNGRCVIYSSQDSKEVIQEITFDSHLTPQSCIIPAHPRYSIVPYISAIVDGTSLYRLHQHSLFLNTRYTACIPCKAASTKALDKFVKGSFSAQFCTKLDILGRTVTMLCVDTASALTFVQIESLDATVFQPQKVPLELDRNIFDICLLSATKLAILCSNGESVIFHDLGKSVQIDNLLLPFSAQSIFRVDENQSDENAEPRLGLIKREDQKPYVFDSATKQLSTFNGSCFILNDAERALYLLGENGCLELYCCLPSPTLGSLSIIAMTSDSLLYHAVDRPENILIRPIFTPSIPKQQISRATSLDLGHGSVVHQHSAVNNSARGAEVLFQIPPISSQVDVQADFKSILTQAPVSSMLSKPQHSYRDIDSLARCWLLNFSQPTFSTKSIISTMEIERPSVHSVSATAEEIFSSSVPGFGVSSEENVVGYWRFQVDDGTEPLRDLSQASPPSKAISSRSDEQISIVDTVVETCTSLDIGDEDLVFSPCAFRGALTLQVPALRKCSSWCIEFWFRLHSDSVEHIIKNQVRLLKSGYFELGRWYHLALVHSQPPDRSATVFIDGESYANTGHHEYLQIMEPTQNPAEQSTNLVLMAGTLDDSEITECRIWNTARTQHDIDRMKEQSLELADMKKKKMMVKIN